MIGGVIIFFTLVLTLSEKSDLFKKPVKKGKVIILLVILGSAVASVIKDLSESQKQNASEKRNISSAKTIDSLKNNSDLQKDLIVRQSLMIDSLRGENKTPAIEYQDSLKSYHYNTTDLLAKYGLKVDTLKGQISKIETAHPEGHIALLAVSSFGFKALRNLDTLQFSFSLILKPSLIAVFCLKMFHKTKIDCLC